MLRAGLELSDEWAVSLVARVGGTQAGGTDKYAAGPRSCARVQHLCILFLQSALSFGQELHVLLALSCLRLERAHMGSSIIAR